MTQELQKCLEKSEDFLLFFNVVFVSMQQAGNESRRS